MMACHNLGTQDSNRTKEGCQDPLYRQSITSQDDSSYSVAQTTLLQPQPRVVLPVTPVTGEIIQDNRGCQPNALPSFSQLPSGNLSSSVTGVSLLEPNSGCSIGPNPPSALTSSSRSGSKSQPSQPTPAESSATSKPRKKRERPRIELAPDQPPTTQGKPRERVYVACLQCRNRKIRCDGARPICHNCSRRPSGGSDCQYDAQPKRRGPDRTPGARQRVARDVLKEVEGGVGPVRRRRQRQEQSTVAATSVNYNTHDQALQSSLTVDNQAQLRSAIDIPSLTNPSAHPVPIQLVAQSDVIYPVETRQVDTILPLNAEEGHIPAYIAEKDIQYGVHPSMYPFVSGTSIVYPPSTSTSYITQLDEYGNEIPSDKAEIGSEPSLNFSRKIWWDSLLSLYLLPNSSRLQTLTYEQRTFATDSITADLRFLFKESNYWFSFFHIPSFFSRYFSSEKREFIQPSLVLGALALSTFWQSSEVGRGHEGRERAMKFRDEAQSALEASFNAGWIDETLAQAAWLLALFEVCAHPYHSTHRSTSSMIMLDSIIRALSLTAVDLDDPQTSVFLPRAVPAVPEHHDPSQLFVPLTDVVRTPYYTSSESSHRQQIIPSYVQQPPAWDSMERGCSCISHTLATNWRDAMVHVPLWSHTPAWNDSWSEAEIRKESCRRLCWSAMTLAAGHISYTTAHKANALDLFIANPANYALLFSGESTTRSPSLHSLPGSSPKDTIWALHDRAFLLWHSCMRMRSDSTATDAEKSRFGMSAWLEADALEEALNKHTCGLERAYIFQGREYLFNTRMCVSYEFQRWIPLPAANLNGGFHRRKAEEWLTHQATVAYRFMQGLRIVTGHATNLLARRPFFVFWFMGQVSRALTLWQCDQTMTMALEVCKAFLPPIDYLTALWPCEEQRLRYDRLRERLNDACFLAGIPLPPPSNYSLAFSSTL